MIQKEVEQYVYTGSGIRYLPDPKGPEQREAGVHDSLEKPKPMD
jgi:hypothetical protein